MKNKKIIYILHSNFFKHIPYSTYTMIPQTSRLPWIDIAKSIAMIAVVFSHEFASVTRLVISCNSFMLPLFFMCSGYCISPKKYNIWMYIKKKTKVLLFPYLLLGILVSAIQLPTNGIHDIIHNIHTKLFSWQTLWFLPVLFLADISLYYLLSKIKKRTLTICGIIILFLIISITLSTQKILLPFDLSTTPIAIVYLSIGYIFKSIITETNRQKKFTIGICLFSIGIVGINITMGNLILKLNDIIPYNKIIFSIMEGGGILLMLSTIFTTNPSNSILHKYKPIIHIFQYIGKNTMVIFAFHMPIFFYCQKFIRPLINNEIYYKSIEFLLIWGICFLLIPFLNRFAPLIIGKQK